MRRPLLVLVACLGSLLALPGSAAAQVGERITSFDMRIAIDEAGDLFVRETIDYDFGVARRHGIQRFLDIAFRHDDVNDRVYRVEVLGVRGSPGTPVGYEVTREGPTLRIRIGDPDRTITGRHTYEIEYRVRGTLNAQPDHDELFWNTVGSRWGVPIDRVRIRVSAPAAATRVRCFTGPPGSDQPCGLAEIRDGGAVFGEDVVWPGEDVTIVVAIPKGAVSEPEPILEERWSLLRAFAVTPLSVGSAAGLLVLVGAGIGRLLWTTGRDRRYVGSIVDVLHGSEGEETVPLLDREAVVAEFAPPDELRPGQVGTLMDEEANPLDVSATIVDLAVRGYLRIEEIEKTWLFGKRDWRFVRLRGDAGGLKEYEALLLAGLFRDGDEVLLSSLKRAFAERLKAVQDAMYRDTVAQGWFVARPDHVRQRWMVIGGAVSLVGAGLIYAAARWTHLGIVPIPIVLGGLGVLAGSRWMPRRTAEGTALARRIRGFKMVLEATDTELSRFLERENLFSRYLPYAIVFGVTEQWAKRFAGLADAPPDTTGWYVGTRPFTVASFTDSVGGFASVSSGSIAATVSSSGGSGFSGGGSGGGGGGGGGGSW
jgi:uncharacterized membrane protein YgcG